MKHLAVFLFAAGGVLAVDYLTEGVDEGRTGWLRGEKGFTLSNVKDTKLLWKVKLDSKPRELHNLFNPLIIEKVTTDKGAKQLLIVAGVSDDLWGIDAANGETVWHRKFDSTYTPPPPGSGFRGGQGGTLCPGGQLAMPTIAPGKTAGSYIIYAVSWDGRLRQLDAANGKDLAPAETFLPPNGKPYALNLHKNVIYTTTAQGCGGVTFAFFSFDLATRRTSIFIPSGGGLWGRRGAAVSKEGIVYMGTGDGPYDPESGQLGNGLVAVKLEQGSELKLNGYYGPSNADWLFKRDLDVNVSPMSLDYKGRKFLIGTSKECTVWLLDRDEFGGDDHRTPLHRTPLICNEEAHYADEGVWGATAAWVDAKGDQWVIIPFNGPVAKKFKAPMEHGRPKSGGVAAFRLEQRANKWTLTPAWLSQDMDMAENAIVANGIVFTYGSGEDTRQAREDYAWNEKPPASLAAPGPAGQTANRLAGGRFATLYALDAMTGKTLWSSGDQIKSWSHFSGISVANGRAYIPTFDGYLYCFGVAK